MADDRYPVRSLYRLSQLLPHNHSAAGYELNKIRAILASWFWFNIFYHLMRYRSVSFQIDENLPSR
jgi:hypothetical protein